MKVRSPRSERWKARAMKWNMKAQAVRKEAVAMQLTGGRVMSEGVTEEENAVGWLLPFRTQLRCGKSEI